MGWQRRECYGDRKTSGYRCEVLHRTNCFATQKLKIFDNGVLKASIHKQISLVFSQFVEITLRTSCGLICRRHVCFQTAAKKQSKKASVHF